MLVYTILRERMDKDAFKELEDELLIEDLKVRDPVRAQEILDKRFFDD